MSPTTCATVGSGAPEMIVRTLIVTKRTSFGLKRYKPTWTLARPRYERSSATASS
jgi:hypothetical protein